MTWDTPEPSLPSSWWSRLVPNHLWVELTPILMMEVSMQVFVLVTICKGKPMYQSLAIIHQ
jgi:hypothetical protein